MPEAAAPPAPPAPLPPTPEQAEALAALEPICFIEAGAGSGKTRVLAERFCDAISAPGAGIESALAFTFTEKAAGELRTRVRDELDRRAQAADGEEAARLRDLGKRMGAAWVTTIHGFCRRLLASHPAAAGVDPRFEVLDQAAADRIAARAFEGALEEWLDDGDPDRVALAASRGADTLSALVRATYERMRTIGIESPSLPPIALPPLEETLARLAHAADVALADTESASGSRAPGIHEGMARAAEAAREGGSPSALFDRLARCAFKQKGSAAIFQGEASTEFLGALKEALGRAAEPRYMALDSLLRDYGERYEDAKRERSALDFEDLQLRAIRLLEARPQIAAAYRSAFGEILVDEFQDTNRIQVRLIALLRGPETRLVTVGDELQAIYGFRNADIQVFREQRGHGRVLPLRGNFRSSAPVLALVNSIGRALIHDFTELTAGLLPEPGAAGGAELLLTPKEGWTPHAAALQGQPDLGASAERVAEARAIAARLVELHDGGQGHPLGEMVVLLRAYTHVAVYEEALARAGLDPYVVGGSGYWSHQQVDDMRCLLGVVANPLDDERLLGALASPAAGVSPDALWLLRQAAGRGRLWPTIREAFDPTREISGSFTSDSEGKAPQIAEGDDSVRWIEAIEAVDAERLTRFCARLAGLRAGAGQLALEALVERTASAFDYDLAVLSMPDGERRWANVRKLMRLAREHEAREGRDVSGFLAAIDARAVADDREAEAQVAPEDHDGVRVMTIHNAKGLEFGVVVVADLNRPLVSGGGAPVVRVGPGRRAEDPPRVGLRLGRVGEKSVTLYDLDPLEAEAGVEDAAEACRLIYVAATRAQRHLILSSIVENSSLSKPNGEPPGPTHQPIAWMLRGLGVIATDHGLALESAEPDGEPQPLGALTRLTLPAPAPRLGLSGEIEEPEVEVRVVEPSAERAAELARTRLARPAPGIPAEAPAAPLLASAPASAPAPPASLTYGALSIFESCGYRYYAERVLGLDRLDPAPGQGPTADAASAEEGQLSLLAPAPPEPATRSGAEFGEAMHSLLEWSARHGLERPDTARVEAALAAAGALGPDALDRAERMLAEWDGSELRAELRAPGTRLVPEAPFSLSIGGSIVRGRLDLLAVRESGTPLIVDFKTDRLAGREPSEIVASSYSLQRDLYALAISPGEPVETAWAFLERPAEPVRHRYEPGDARSVRDRIEALIGAIARGRFEVTPAPHWGLCSRCPARPALCSHPAEMTSRRLP